MHVNRVKQSETIAERYPKLNVEIGLCLLILMGAGVIRLIDWLIEMVDSIALKFSAMFSTADVVRFLAGTNKMWITMWKRC